MILVENNTIVVHANGLGQGIVRYVQIVMPGFGLMHTTEMRRRDAECSYEWYATTPFSFDYDVSCLLTYLLMVRPNSRATMLLFTGAASSEVTGSETSMSAPSVQGLHSHHHQQAVTSNK